MPLRLTVHHDQYPSDGVTVHYSEGLSRAFAVGGPQPLFSFGFGLSYTQLRFDDLRATLQPDGRSATVSFHVTNTGQRAGAEVAQLYLGFPPIAEGNEPPIQLKGFSKVRLNPGESKLVELELNPRAFSYWSETTHAWQIASGTFQVMAGDSSADLPLHTTLGIR